MKKTAMLNRRFENIITYLRHQITNAASDSLNANEDPMGEVNRPRIPE
jgi:hypothetical protein